MPPFETFIWGFVGSAMVEIVNVYGYFNNGEPSLPPRYLKPAFWVVRFLLAVTAGGLALAYGIQKPILAINIGAATPLIVQALAKSTPDDIAETDKDLLPNQANSADAENRAAD